MRRLFLLPLALLLGAGLALLYLRLHPVPLPLPLPAPLRAGGGFVQGLEAPINLLLMGVDIPYAGPRRPLKAWNGNTDTMVLVRLDPLAHRLVLLTLPRDTYALIPGHGYGKLNGANPLGGPELARRAVETLLGVQVDRYLLVNLAFVRRAVDLLGGVEVYIPERMDYDDQAAGLHIHLRPGLKRLDGAQAEAFLRFRHDALGDIGRVQRQQAFLEAVWRRVQDPALWPRLPGLLPLLAQEVRTDLSQEEVGRILRFLEGKPQVVRLLLPGRFWHYQGLSYWRMDEEAALSLVARYLEGRAPAGDKAPPPRVRIAVRGPGAAEVARRLRGLGLEAFAEGYAVERPERTCLLTNGDEAGAQALAAWLGVGCVEVSGTGSLFADYTLLLGPEGLRVRSKMEVGGTR